MYKTDPCNVCEKPAPGTNDDTAHMAKNMARNLISYAQLLKKHPLTPKTH